MGGLGMRHSHITLNPVPSALALVLVRRSSPCSREAMARICGGGRLLPPHCVPMLATAGSVDVSRGQGLPHQNRRSSPLPDTFCALPALGAYSTVFGTTPPCSSRAFSHAAWSATNSALTVPWKCLTAISVSTGMRSSESSGMPLTAASIASSPSSPMVPPMKIWQPGTAFILPSASLHFLAGPPISPISAACAWPHELGQPVQWMRSALGTVTRFWRSRETISAGPLVSIIARPQNCAPVQLTTLPTMLPGSTERREAPLRLGSASNAWSALSSTLGRMTFCSTVSRTSPAEYLSARSAICRASVTEMRPTGTCTPTRDLPACGCECTPRRERRSKGAVALGCASSTLVDISLTTRLRKASLACGWPLTCLISP
mmetsp:Transcript_40382/g.96744  ORF Transcript_40382/g.96744 Transcript_40382/m.96744 type:complete len:375 (-) Transcript_40382:1094-2218(-)